MEDDPDVEVSGGEAHTEPTPAPRPAPVDKAWIEMETVRGEPPVLPWQETSFEERE